MSGQQEFQEQVAETIRMFRVALHAAKAAPCDDDDIKQFVVQSLKGDIQRVRALAVVVEQGMEAAQKLAAIVDDEDDDGFDDALRQIRDLPESP